MGMLRLSAKVVTFAARPSAWKIAEDFQRVADGLASFHGVGYSSDCVTTAGRGGRRQC